MRISVALCVYNGERFLRAQLDSIARQSRLPDEVVICDDASSDGSWALVEGFAAAAPFPVHAHRGTANVGSTRNFARAIALCRGDVIALCDQDDVWLEDKLARIATAFARRPQTTMAFADAILVDENLAPEGRTLWQAVGFGRGRQRRAAGGAALIELLKGNFVTGATMAIAASTRDVALPIPELGGLLHDGWLALVAAALGPVEPIAAPGIRYRLHARQQVGVPSQGPADVVAELRRKLDHGTRGDYLHNLADLAVLEQRLGQHAGRPGVADALMHIAGRRVHARARSTMPRARLRRVSAVLAEARAGRYRYSSGWRSVLRDLLLN
jgi:hypothetical protein